MTNRAVYRVGLQRDKVKDVAASTAALAEVVDVDRAALARTVRGAGPQQFVEAITLRKGDYEPLADAIDRVVTGHVVASGRLARTLWRTTPTAVAGHPSAGQGIRITRDSAIWDA